ncbi:hypothetical protein GCM10010472_08600 [Pseudonocardia halophobica]|uniref:Uncharacterized protein n=1 Tax=Pseudonocardia halophobica TaxID=29401 RepID=A0A9W6NX26_9PSEU|nr:hypothetical protein GCM10017577_41430 [Pseudonocardia halophobica]
MPAQRRVAVEGLHGARCQAVQPQRQQRDLARDRVRSHGTLRITRTLPVGRPSGAPYTIGKATVPNEWISYPRFAKIAGMTIRGGAGFHLSGE